MARLDEATSKIVISAVYDGVAGAGKTTNLHKLCEFFTRRRRSEVVTPAELDGRTLFFDWLQLDAGLVLGRSLRCHLYTVPGQRTLSHRRALILEMADVVIFVSESTPSGIERGRRRFARLSEYLESVGRPLIVQANKQDSRAALEPEEVLERLGGAPGTPLIGATAVESTGVRETAVLAIRAAADAVQRQILASGVESIMPLSETPEELHARLNAPRASVASGSALALLDESGLEALTDDEREAEREFADELPTDPACPSLPIRLPPPLVPAPPPEPILLAPEAGAETSSEPPFRAPWPSASVPSGFIWPGTRARELLAGLDFSVAVHKSELTGQPGHLDGSGRDDLVVYQIGDWCLKTSVRRRYDDADDARAALAHQARAKVSLGHLLLDGTALALAREPSGSYWLWTIAPWRTTLRRAMSDADSSASLAEALLEYAGAVLASIDMAARRGIVLDVHPSNFASSGSGLAYLDDDIAMGSRLPAIGHSIIQRVSEFADRRDAVDVYIDRLAAALAEREPEAITQTGLIDAIAAASAATPAAATARARLLTALRPR